MSRCDDCKMPADGAAECLAVLAPQRYGHFCVWARGSDPNLHNVIVGRSRLGLDPKPPGLIRKAVNLAGAVAHHVAEGMPAATDQQRAERLAICRSNRCGLYGEDDTCRHSACGCDLVAKTAMADQACPLGLWGPVERQPSVE